MNRMTWLRASYWLGAAADAVVGVGMVYPPLLATMLRLEETPTSVATRSALYSGAALMFGWTALLIWGSLRPVERKGILALTVFPVILGLALGNLYGYVTGYIPSASAISIWAFQLFLVSVFLSAYFLAPKGGDG